MLSGLAMQAEILSLRDPARPPEELVYIRDISRQAVGKLRDMVWSIDSRRDRLHDLVDRMREQAQEMLPPHEIDYRFQVEGLRMEQPLPVDTRRHLYLFFKEAITNICKHSQADQVVIFFGTTNGQVLLSIHDNGHGPFSMDSTGMGLSNMELRAQALGGRLEVVPREGEGFMVQLLLRGL
jgi:signal transduction histidine kinase